ncbi:amyloid-beta A4 precursor -binding family B member 1 isoform X2 [Paramuricea clavata]|uniref:Amyloid-beta A4 -binding family B member 1 isoform X2 n=1 Tax=Paramuricea clavata TaxID=317549 RepID=A0A6S7HFY9_PARCT|nr:amyloid-beta A4 precursor -binding family B member 1 isoform X2 [Paramuricea clavata]
MRVWGAGREEQKDFAYVARDQVTGKHKCHVFRCHGNISGRAIHNKLHEMCNRILEEKRRARENQQNDSTKQWSDILNTPPKPSAKDQAGFNVKPVTESKKRFSGKFIGKVDVPRPTGIDVVHRAIDVAIASRDPNTWRTCLIEITVSSVRCTDCLSQHVITENRIKFVSFIGVAKDVRFCGYISSGDESSPFLCHVFQCTPNAASFTKALEEACRSGAGIKGFLGKLANQAKLGVPIRRASPEPNVSSSKEQQPSSTELLIKYYGHQPVSVGTGPTAIREAVGVAQGTTFQICTINISPHSITLDDSIKSGTSRKHIHSNRENIILWTR